MSFQSHQQLSQHEAVLDVLAYIMVPREGLQSSSERAREQVQLSSPNLYTEAESYLL